MVGEPEPLERPTWTTTAWRSTRFPRRMIACARSILCPLIARVPALVRRTLIVRVFPFAIANVTTHIENLMRKLQVKSRGQAIALAYRSDLLAAPAEATRQRRTEERARRSGPFR